MGKQITLSEVVDREMSASCHEADGVEFTDHEREEIYRVFEEYRERFMEQLKTEEDPRKLFKVFMAEVRKILRDKDLPKPIRNDIRRLVSEAFDVLRELSTDHNNKDDDDYAKVVIENTKLVSELILPKQKYPEVPYTLIPIEDLDLDAVLPGLVLPEGQVGYKGGVARVALKRYAELFFRDRFDASLMDAELPLSDKDAVVGPGEDAWARADEMGVDPDGVEKLKDFNINKYLATRDITMNEVLLTHKGLYYTPQALDSVLTGVVHGNKRGKTLFGVDAFYHEGKAYLTNKILQRLVKTVCEKKAESFELPTYNLDVSMGIYWLVLLRKAMGKKNQAEKIAAIHSCAVQMGQTDEESPVAFIRGLLEKYPFFSFEGNQSATDVARWIMTKYVNLMKRYLKDRFQAHMMEWPYTSDDDTPAFISPDISNISPAELEAIDELVDELSGAEEKLQPATGVVPSDDSGESQKIA